MRMWTAITAALVAVVALLWWPQPAEPAQARWVWPDWPAPTVLVDPTTGLDQTVVEAEVVAIVRDPRGWRQDLSHVTVQLVVPGTFGVEPMPGLIGRANRDTQQVTISAQAWTTLGPRLQAAGGTLQDQRTWVLMHEIGHQLIGYGHVDPVCPDGGPAPLMRPATYRLGDGCDLGVWPTWAERQSPGPES